MGEIITVGPFNYKFSSAGTWAPAVRMEATPRQDPTVWLGLQRRQPDAKAVTEARAISAVVQNWAIRCPGGDTNWKAV